MKTRRLFVFLLVLLTPILMAPILPIVEGGTIPPLLLSVELGSQLLLAFVIPTSILLVVSLKYMSSKNAMN